MLKIRIVEIAKKQAFFYKRISIKKTSQRAFKTGQKRYLDEESSLSYSAGRLLLKKALLEKWTSSFFIGRNRLF